MARGFAAMTGRSTLIDNDDSVGRQRRKLGAEFTHESQVPVGLTRFSDTRCSRVTCSMSRKVKLPQFHGVRFRGSLRVPLQRIAEW